MTAEQILQTLDAEFEVIHHDPPHLYQLATYFYPTDARLTVFRSAEHWALFFEIVGCGAGLAGMRVDVRRYGDCLETQSARHESRPLQLLDAHTGQPLDSDGVFDPQRFAVIWNGGRYDFTPSEADYAEAGVVFDETRTDPQAHAVAQVVRYLCERLDHPFFLTEDELRGLLAQGWVADEAPRVEAMTLFLQTRGWRHPDLSQGELPSRISSFQIIARALESGDISAWARQDPAIFNTDWRVYDWEEKAQEEQQAEREARQEREWEALTAEARERFTGDSLEDPGFVILPGEAEFPFPG